MVTLYLTGTSIRLESKLPVGEHMLEKYKKFQTETPKEFCIRKTRRGCFAYLNQHYNGSDVTTQAVNLDDENRKIIERLATMKTEDEKNLNFCVTVLNKQGYNLLADWLHGKLAPVLEIQNVEFEQESAPCCENDKKIEQSKLTEFEDKVKPKFHEGDWTVSNLDGKARQISEVHSDEHNSYYVIDGKSVNLKEYDRLHHLWTIRDAKDGDVLLFEGYYNSIVLFQGIGINGEGRINYHCKCDLGNYSFGIQGDVACLGTIEKNAEQYHLATKEQRDLLFQKMHKAGYEWDAEKKELKKIEKSAWSEEDENRFNNLCQLIDASNDNELTKNGFKNWLKSFKDSVLSKQEE